MTPEQYAELYAIGLFNQEQAKLAWNNDQPQHLKKCWHDLTKKERNKWRTLADDLIEEAGA